MPCLSESYFGLPLSYFTWQNDEVPPRTRLFRRKGKTRKLKYSTKSAGHPSVWKRIAGGKNQSCKQYTPCGCLSMCGKDCPCLTNETCCEKYCGYANKLTSIEVTEDLLITIHWFNSGAQKAVKIVSEDVIVQRVNAEVGSVPALLLAENVIQMFAEIAGLGSHFKSRSLDVPYTIKSTIWWVT